MSHRSSLCVAAALALAAGLGGTSPAAAAEPRTSFGEHLWLGARVAPLGLTLESETTFRWRFGPDGDELLEDDHLDVGAFVGASPVMSMVGGLVEFQPAAFFVLRARALRLDWFGTFGLLSKVDGLDGDWSPERLSDLEDADQGTVSSGSWLDIDAQLRAKVGGFIAVLECRPAWIHSAIGGPYYEPYNDILLAADDLLVDAQAIAGWLFDDSLFVGARWELMVSDAARQPRQTVAALVHWETALGGARDPAHPPSAATTFSLDGLVGAYAEDRYRAGEAWGALAATLAWRL
ncbi:MAG: hypothetical protein U1F43_27650 [Myxococcota bacterium]